VTIAATELKSMKHVTVRVTQHGKRHAYEGVPLTVVLRVVAAPAGEKLRGADLADVVLVFARDGYRVALSLAETDPAMRRETIIVADRMDGAAIPSSEGPYKLVVDGDLKPARSARMVERIALTRVGDKGSIPSSA
jgi:hypothetical protein